MNTRPDTKPTAYSWEALLRASKNWRAICLPSPGCSQMTRVNYDILVNDKVSKKQLVERDQNGMGACIGLMFVKSIGVSANRLKHPQNEKNTFFIKKAEQFGDKTVNALREQSCYCYANRSLFFSRECRELDEVMTEIEKFTQELRNKNKI